MSNHTKVSAISQSSILHPDTVALCRLSDRVALVVVETTRVAGSLLNWPKSAVYFLEEVLLRLGEDDAFELKHEDFGFDLWPYLSKAARTEKMSRRVGKLKELMLRSGWQAVWIDPRRTVQTRDGAYFGLPTLYKRGVFWDLFAGVQVLGGKVDLFALSKVERRKRIRVIVDGWLEAEKCKPIERAQIEQAQKEEKPKERATWSEAKGAIEDAGRVTNEDNAQKIERIGELIFEAGIEWVNLERNLADYWRKMMAIYNEADQRLARAVTAYDAPKSRKEAAK